MGNFLRILTGEKIDTDGSPCYLDFENASPTEAEKEVFEKVGVVLERSKVILAELKAYTGASEEIREAIGNPRDEQLQEKTWTVLLPLVDKLKEFYLFSLEIGKVLPDLLCGLTNGPESVLVQLEQKQALAKQFAELLRNTFIFDDLKMNNPNIQNDFSYFRRTLSRKRLANENEEVNVSVSAEMANKMSLFYADPTPFLKILSDGTSSFVSNSANVENTTRMLEKLCYLCRTMASNESLKFENEETQMFILSVMVGVLILFDHVHPDGAFHKDSKIDIKAAITCLKKQPPGSCDALFNALRYTTKHLNDDTTPAQIRKLLA